MREIRNGSVNGGVSNNCLIGVNECICKSSGFGKCRDETRFKLRGMNFFVQRFKKTEISILEVVINALLALIF